MKFGVFYASQTGNNEHLMNHICDQIKQVIQDAEFNKFHIEEIENKINKKEDVKFEVYDAYIIGSYVDCYQLPPYVPKFLDFIQKDIKDKPILTFLAHGGGAGCVGRQFNQILNKYQAKHMEHVEMKYCNNYAGLTYPKNKDEKQGINIQQFEQLDKNVKVFAQNLIDKKDQTPKFTKSSLFIKIFFKGFTSLFMKTMKQKIIIDQDKCIQCMKCCQICPQNCFEFNQETKQVQFINSDNCVGCRGCMQNCPQNAIDNKDGLMKKYVQYHFDEYQLIKDDKFHTIEELKQLHSQI